VRTFQVARGFPKLSVFQHLMLYGRDQPGESLWQAIVGTRAARERETELAERAWQTARFLRLDHLIDNPAPPCRAARKKLLESAAPLNGGSRLVLLDRADRRRSTRPCRTRSASGCSSCRGRHHRAADRARHGLHRAPLRSGDSSWPKARC